MDATKQEHHRGCISITVPYMIEDKIRIDTFLARSIDKVSSRSQLKPLFNQSHINVNGKACKASYRVNPLDRIEITMPAPSPVDILPEPMNLSIVYEDGHLLAINKPAGLTVHPGHGQPVGTLVNGLVHYCSCLAKGQEKNRPGLVHRLDKMTSGIIIVAKNDRTHVLLSEQFRKRKIIKTYYALVWGHPQREGVIESVICRHPNKPTQFMVSSLGQGKWSHTSYWVEHYYKHTSWLRLQLHTGRTHQARVHLSHIRNSIFGDNIYRKSLSWECFSSLEKVRYHNLLSQLKGHALHAYSLTFIHPGTQKITTLIAPIPEDIKEIVKQLSMSKEEK